MKINRFYNGVTRAFQALFALVAAAILGGSAVNGGEVNQPGDSVEAMAVSAPASGNVSAKNDVMILPAVKAQFSADSFYKLPTNPKAATSTGRISVNPLNAQFPDISLFVTVLDASGNTVSNLAQTDFTVWEQSSAELTATPEVITGFEASAAPSGISFSLVCDVSGSMAGTPLANVKTAAINFLNNCTSADRGNLVRFSSFNQIALVRASDWIDQNGLNNLTVAINGLAAGGNTAFFDGTATGISSLSQEPSPKAVIVFTDGDSNNDHYYTANTLITLARNEGVPIYTIGLGNSVNTSMLTSVATQTGGSYHHTTSAADMGAVYAAIANEVRSSYTIHYRTHNPNYEIGRAHV